MVSQKDKPELSDTCKHIAIEKIRERQMFIKNKVFSNNEVDKELVINELISHRKDVLLGQQQFTRMVNKPNIFRWYYLTFVNLWSREISMDFSYIPRNPANIQYLFSTYKNQIYKIIKAEMYKKTGTDIVVNELLKSYEVFNNKVNLKQIKQLTFKDNIIEYFVNMAYPPEMLKDKDLKPDTNYQYRSWLYSFWYRRYLEGNMETVYQILKEIDAHYENQK